MAVAVAPLLGKGKESNPTGQARSEVLVEQSMEQLQIRPTTLDVAIHGLPTTQIEQADLTGTAPVKAEEARLASDIAALPEGSQWDKED